MVFRGGLEDIFTVSEKCSEGFWRHCERCLESGQVNSGLVRSSQVRPSQVRSGQVNSGPVRRGPIRTGEVRTGPFRTGEVRTVQVRTGQVRQSWKLLRHLGTGCPVGLETSSRILMESPALFVVSRIFALTYALLGYFWVNLA